VKVLIVENDPDVGCGALNLAIRAKSYDHGVRLFMRTTERNKFVGKGLVNRVADLDSNIGWCDFIFNCDNSKYLGSMERARNLGKIVISATPETAKWELDRGYGMEILKKAKVQIPESQLFADYNKAIAYVKKTMKRCVSKPNGDADKDLSYCAKSPADLVYMLERWKKSNKLKSSFFIQDFIPGVEMAVGGWFGPGGFNQGFCENFEFKKLMNGDIGVATGEMGTVLRYVRTSKLADKVLLPLVPQLEKAQYCGYIDVNCIIDEEGSPWPLEFTTRPGWPTFNIQQELHDGDPIEWMVALANGEDLKASRMNEIAVGVVLAIPDFPYSRLTNKDIVGIPIYNITPSLWPHIHPCSMMLGQAPMEVKGAIVTCPCPCTAGDYVMVVTASGQTVVEAKERVYRRVEKMEIPNNLMYRTDIGSRLQKQLPKVQLHGYAKGMQYRS